ncbi:bromo adjacent homology domain-containing 1 protein isoform X1 [Lepisosteus oculatus]|uniref:bromo adjacent homology domain-containing 1 protein isoform X1 n=2 Tax=Lepisosteus oculatus TaxID=7918 RepID=UPI0037154E3B
MQNVFFSEGAVGKYVMTHARQKDSLSRYPSEGRDQVGGGPHGEAMGGAWPECPLREGRTKQGVAKKGGAKESKDLSGEQDRKSYPLRKRSGVAEVGTRNCRVVLTRLEESTVQDDVNLENLSSDIHEQSCIEGQEMSTFNSCGKKTSQVCNQTLEPKTEPKPDLSSPLHEPRKRRLASLNAEAVNSLLLEREDFQQGTKNSKKPTQRLHGECVSSKELSKDPMNAGEWSDAPKGSHAPKSDSCGSPNSRKKARIDTESVKSGCPDGPAPRRLAGLNAAALLKLTSASAGNKRRVKTDCKGVCGGVGGKQHPKSRKRRHKQPTQLQLIQQGSCALCKKEGFTPKIEWEGTTGGGDGFFKLGNQCRSMLGYPMKDVKEEQTETEVDPFYCCPQEKSMEYCHRLALFLGRQPYAEPEEHSPDSLKQEFLIPTHSLAHPALTVGTHPYLCPDPCFSGYYLHIGHPGASSPPLTTGPVPYPPSTVPSVTLCPSSKLLTSAVSHPSGIPHPAFCGSVGSPCFGEACRVNGFTTAAAYRAVQPVAGRRCTFNTGCTGCSNKIKTESYITSLDGHSPAIPVSPTLPLSGCPVPTVPPAAQSVPHVQTPLSDPSQPQAQLKVARECPQSAKPPSGSRSGVRSTAGCPHLSDSQLTPGHASSTGKQQRITRRRATNGWLPIGLPIEKEVFIVGEDEPALRRCYEGVQRDGEIIRVRDTVLLRSGPRKKSLPYVAKISALWEDPKTGELMMSLFWYYRPEHTQGGRIPSMHCENEIFASRHQDENSVACIEDKCYVLTLAQYCRFCALVKRRGEGLPESAPMVPPSPEYFIPAHRRVPAHIDPDLVFLCRHVYDFRYGRILKNLQ